MFCAVCWLLFGIVLGVECTVLCFSIAELFGSSHSKATVQGFSQTVVSTYTGNSCMTVLNPRVIELTDTHRKAGHCNSLRLLHRPCVMSYKGYLKSCASMDSQKTCHETEVHGLAIRY